MSWLSDYIAARRKRRAELYKDRPWITPAYWLAVICSTIAMLYGYSRAVDYYFFVENADAAYFKNTLARKVEAGERTLRLDELVPYKDHFDSACMLRVPVGKDPTEYMSRFKGEPVEDIPWHFRTFLILQSKQTEKIIAFKIPEITTMPLPDTALYKSYERPKTFQTSLTLGRNISQTNPFYTCVSYGNAGFKVTGVTSPRNSARPETYSYRLSDIEDIKRDVQ